MTTEKTLLTDQSLDAIRVYTGSDILDGAPVLPDFTCSVAGLFS